MNFDLGLLGIDLDELARLLDPGNKDGLCDPDEVPAPPDEAMTNTTRGQWHRAMHYAESFPSCAPWLAHPLAYPDTAPGESTDS